MAPPQRSPALWLYLRGLLPKGRRKSGKAIRIERGRGGESRRRCSRGFIARGVYHLAAGLNRIK